MYKYICIYISCETLDKPSVKHKACRCPTAGAAVPAAHGRRLAGA